LSKIKRKIIKIDEDLCTGCGACIPNCVEQALQVVDTPKGKKARLVKEMYCDGLGACLGVCPEGALTIEERISNPFDEEATNDWIKQVDEKYKNEVSKNILTQSHQNQDIQSVTFSCPSSRTLQWNDKNISKRNTTRIDSELRQWPVQLHLIPPNAPYFKNADFVIIADCVPFAYANFHQDFLKDNAVAVGCPKLDDANAYVEKIAQIIQISELKSIKVVYMEVPCCSGLVQIVRLAAKRAGISIPIEEITISIKGEQISKKVAQNVQKY